jgi:hypothetical protein
MNFWCFGVDSQYSVSGPLHAAIYGLTMTHGKQVAGGLVDSRGGAISYRNSSPSPDLLTLNNCIIENSAASSGSQGGIYAEDALSISNCQIIYNMGDGIYISGPGPLNITNTWIANNTNDGINTAMDTVLVNSTLSGNSADGIYSGAGNDALLNCTVTGNNTTVAAFSGGVEMHSLDLVGTYTNCTIVGNLGEDVRTVVGPTPGNMIFTNSIVGSMVVQYGGFTSQGNNIFVNGLTGGTVQTSDVVFPIISSLTPSSGGSLIAGKYFYKVAAVTTMGTITSLESSVSVGANGSVVVNWTAPVLPAGSTVSSYQIFRSLVSGTEQQVATVPGTNTSYNDLGAPATGPVPALLVGPLTNNGGPTPTMALVGGPLYAFGTANPALAPLTDQRGYPRPDELGEQPDIGAFEVQDGWQTPSLPAAAFRFQYHRQFGFGSFQTSTGTSIGTSYDAAGLGELTVLNPTLQANVDATQATAGVFARMQANGTAYVALLTSSKTVEIGVFYGDTDKLQILGTPVNVGATSGILTFTVTGGATPTLTLSFNGVQKVQITGDTTITGDGGVGIFAQGANGIITNLTVSGS